MATFRSGDFALNFFLFDISGLNAATPLVESNSLIRLSDNFGGIVDFRGDFFFDAFGNVIGGTLNYVREELNGQLVQEISDLSLPASTVYNLIINNDSYTLQNIALAGADNIFGSPFDDRMFGLAGNDFIDAGSGTDIVDYFGPRSEYSVIAYNGQIGVSDSLSGSNPAFRDGADIVVNAEFLDFADIRISMPAEQFQALDYVASHTDLIQLIGANGQAGFEHYVRGGFYEGRAISFDGLEYIASHGDLINAFGVNAIAGATHYINAGFAEGRTVAFNSLEYIASFDDLITAFGANGAAGSTHFITSGRSEGREITFDDLEYIASFDDLIPAFGLNGTEGTKHFINVGNGEGRETTFDAFQYIASYDDLLLAFRTNADAGSEHFISKGFVEARSRDLFDAEQYLKNYADLAAVFGTDQGAATLHYIETGFDEGRSDEFIFG